jgi:hypothetical protein
MKRAKIVKILKDVIMENQQETKVIYLVTCRFLLLVGSPETIRETWPLAWKI